MYYKYSNILILKYVEKLERTRTVAKGTEAFELATVMFESTVNIILTDSEA